jgi:sulfonate transport system ATP-binding protein
MIELAALVKSYDAFRALGPLDLSIGDERVIGIIGPSGSGKTTLLRLLAGLETSTSGSVFIDGDRLAGPRSDIGVVFQEPRLMPWLTVRKNVEFGIWDVLQRDRGPAVDAAIERVGLTAFADALPRQLSGGMAQRVGIACALVGGPRLLLLDEPFAALDPLTRVAMQEHLLAIVGTTVPTTIVITHDIDEALVLSDRVIVLKGPPARIARAIDVDLPRPRTRTSPEFGALKALLLDELIVRTSSSAPVLA